MTGRLADKRVVATLRAGLWSAGFRAVPVRTSDKRPKGAGWQERARRDPPEAAEALPELDALSTGILCDGLRAVDVDVDDPDTVSPLRALAVETLGTALVRLRDNSPRVLLLYRATEGEPPKRSVSGTRGKVEILGHGQQFVAFGTHPSGAALRWDPEAPGEFTRDSLTAVTEAQVTAFLAAAAPIIGAEAPQADASSASNSLVRTPSARGPSAEPQDVAAALAVIPNDGPPDWEHWNKVGMATWRATGSSLAGFAAWCAWSEKNLAHDPRACQERWPNYAKSPPTDIGAGTLFYLAAQARPGWTKPSVQVMRAHEVSEAYEGEPYGGGPALAGGGEPPSLAVLHRTSQPAPTLPLGALGPFWGPWVAQAAEGTNAPPDYVALPLLATASALIGNARWGQAWPGWSEPPVLWCASVGNPSSGKSPGAAPVVRDALRQVEALISHTNSV